MVIIFTANISQLANMDWPEKISKMTNPPPQQVLQCGLLSKNKVVLSLHVYYRLN